jgi:hypothetical protein
MRPSPDSLIRASIPESRQQCPGRLVKLAYPFVGAGTRNGGDTVAWKPIDAFTIDAIVKKARSVVNATRLVVSRDGKALTITENGTGPNGRATHGVRVYKER